MAGELEPKSIPEIRQAEAGIRGDLNPPFNRIHDLPLSRRETRQRIIGRMEAFQWMLNMGTPGARDLARNLRESQRRQRRAAHTLGEDPSGVQKITGSRSLSLGGGFSAIELLYQERGRGEF